MDNILKGYWDDICYIQAMVQGDLPDWHDLLGGFKAPVFPSLDAVIRPTLSFLSSEMFGSPKDKSYNLASIFQLTHIAWLVHKQVHEDEDITGNEIHSRQFPVLIGDYIYSRCYAKLCNVGLNDFLLPLADIICSVNEGGLLGLQNPQAEVADSNIYKQVIYKETAIPLGGACKLGASLGFATEEEQDLLDKFGRAVGMVYRLADKPKYDTKEYRDKALLVMDSFETHPAQRALRELVCKIACLGEHH